MPKTNKINENSAIFRTLRTIIVAMVVFALGFALVSIYVGLDRVIEPIQQVGWKLVMILLGLSLVNYFLRSLRWLVLNRTLGIPITPLDAVITYFAGFALQMTPMKAGEALRLWLTAKRYQIGYQRVVPLLLADKLYDAIGLYLASVIGAISFPDYRFIYLWVGVYIAVRYALLTHPKYLHYLVGLIYRLTRRKRKRFWAGTRTSVRSTERLLTWRMFFPSVIISVLGWLAEIYAFSLLLKQMGAIIPIAKAGFVFVFGMGAGAVSFSPGGLGAAELTMERLLHVMDVPTGVALAAVLIIRLTTLWFAVLLGMSILPIAIKRTRRMSKL
ncbi:MAG: lysylphosphatidylglycerol synthase transmembrane domain-containing protein [Candidatus Symbiobacter sp.]|nr:lysylphosphatidylglycerol synthase transmembrane domain-containing protein [Candidatus Symbiobacter sp.]